MQTLDVILVMNLQDACDFGICVLGLRVAISLPGAKKLKKMQEKYRRHKCLARECLLLLFIT